MKNNFEKRVCGITRKSKASKKHILNLIQKVNYPLSTRQLTLEIGCSWNTIQNYCLELVLEKKIERLHTRGSHLWVPLDFMRKSPQKETKISSQ